MEESLAPREIPGGVGTCRLDFSDIGGGGDTQPDGGMNR